MEEHSDPEQPPRFVIMVLDIRNSTLDISKPGIDSDEVAFRLRRLIKHFKEIAGDREPKFMKSTGDGLFCVWKLGANDKRADTKIDLLKLAVALNKDLPARLGPDWQAQVEIGIGLTAGTLHFEDNGITDYFGYFANLASKLQDAARPGGLVVDGNYLQPMSGAASRLLFKEVGLSPHKITEASPLYRYSLYECYTSQPVMLPHNWTCLAWPGFAITEYSDGGIAGEGRSLGLNHRGITVVTHEGLQGNIGSLAISRAYSTKDEGDTFEIYIDDYDALQLLDKQGLAHLFDGHSVRHEIDLILDRVTSCLRDCISKEFLFIPIRCGINALAAHPSLPFEISSVKHYANLVDHLSSRSSQDLKPHQIGLYDNMGATLPLLLMMMDGRLNHKRVYNATSKRLSDCFSRLKRLTKKHKFKRYSTIDSMARGLRRGTIKMVLGGGAWLTDPQSYDDPDGAGIVFHVPPQSGGLLWIEGAALLSDLGKEKAESLLKFLREAVLSEEFQKTLTRVRPYPSSPTADRQIKEILNSGSSSPVCAETARIFTNLGQLNDNLTIRRVSTKNPEAWVETFRTIMDECCED